MSDGTRRTGDTVAIEGDYQFRALHEGRAPQRFWHSRRLQASLDLLAPRAGDRVLDVGCGSGVFSDMVARAGADVLGIDANEAAVNFATRQFGRDGLAFQRGWLDELGLAEQSFDRIALLEVIEHVYPAQAKQLLASFRRLLKPGGRLVLSTPNERSLWPVVEWAMDHLGAAPQMAEEQHVASYSPGSLQALCEAEGFRVERCATTLGVAPWLTLLSGRLADRVHDLEQRRLPTLGCIVMVALTPVTHSGANLR